MRGERFLRAVAIAALALAFSAVFAGGALGAAASVSCVSRKGKISR